MEKAVPRLAATMLLFAALLPATAAASPPADAPVSVFDCAIGRDRLRVERVGERFTYRYDSADGGGLALPRRIGSAGLRWHRTLFPRGSRETLRFVRGRYSYVVFADYRLPLQDFAASDATGELVFVGDTAAASGVIVLHGDRIVARRQCNDDAFFSLDEETQRHLRDDDDTHRLFDRP